MFASEHARKPARAHTHTHAHTHKHGARNTYVTGSKAGLYRQRHRCELTGKTRRCPGTGSVVAFSHALAPEHHVYNADTQIHFRIDDTHTHAHARAHTHTHTLTQAAEMFSAAAMQLRLQKKSKEAGHALTRAADRCPCVYLYPYVSNCIVCARACVHARTHTQIRRAYTTMNAVYIHTNRERGSEAERETDEDPSASFVLCKSLVLLVEQLRAAQRANLPSTRPVRGGVPPLLFCSEHDNMFWGVLHERNSTLACVCCIKLTLARCMLHVACCMLHIVYAVSCIDAN